MSKKVLLFVLHVAVVWVPDLLVALAGNMILKLPMRAYTVIRSKQDAPLRDVCEMKENVPDIRSFRVMYLNDSSRRAAFCDRSKVICARLRKSDYRFT